MKILVINQSSVRAPRKFIDQWCAQIQKHFVKRRVLDKKHASLELTVVFLDPGPAKKMNLQFRQKNYATDVLSFASMEPGTLGELVLCPQVLQRQAKEHGLTYRQELGYMLLHGVLHLLGYDHETGKKDADLMFGLQDAVFAELLS
jgi:probable rRNA maturation factor